MRKKFFSNHLIKKLPLFKDLKVSQLSLYRPPLGHIPSQFIVAYIPSISFCDAHLRYIRHTICSLICPKQYINAFLLALSHSAFISPLLDGTD